ncbi:NADH-quinone oxidoreductase subunit E [Marinovum algicola]|uniref:NADH-quinone oxidoreductase subunit E n=1 Tax=Marinovum algicola TaxID=42444 RepID=UPI0024B974C8|nr:NADH-quinone oxidoreductase subunit E [Marinovum algicola]
MLRRLYPDQPESFAFTEANLAWAEAQVTKYPEGRQASAVIPLLWRAQEQEGWLTRPAIEHVADMLGMAYIRVLEVASFYFMFQLQPVGSVAHIQVCGTTSCMICGAEDLIGVCRDKIAPAAHQLSEDGRFSWEEVECLGACANAPMAQIGKDYYEDLTAARLAEIIDEMAAGQLPVPGPQNGRYTSEPAAGLTSLAEGNDDRHQYNASAQLATDLGDTIKRIDGSEVALSAPWQKGANHGDKPASVTAPMTHQPRPSKGDPADETGIDTREAHATTKGHPISSSSPETDAEAAGHPTEDAKNLTADGDKDAVTASKGKTAKKPKAKSTKKMAKTETAKAETADVGQRPQALDAPRGGKADDLKKIKGIGPKLEELCHSLGFYHFDQIAAWTEDEVAWVDQNLEGFKGRVTRDDWMSQAKVLAEGGETEFSSRDKE